MKVTQIRWSMKHGWEPHPPSLDEEAQLLMLFGSTGILKAEHPPWLADLQRAYPQALHFGCSTAGEIFDNQVSDDTLIVTAFHFAHTQLQGTTVNIHSVENSFEVGKQLALSLAHDDLAHVLVLSDGTNVNGSELVAGLSSHLPKNITVTGGLAGDGDRFQQTYIWWNGEARKDEVAVLGLYGKHLEVGYASLGGWDPFGPERLITRAKDNVLYELDGKSALGLYKMYLGEHAQGLPATGLLFPLSLRMQAGETGVVRTILGINEVEQSMTFAGDMPIGAYARLMRANFDRLIDGAVSAAQISVEAIERKGPDFALLISCVGRKLVLQQRIEEEVEGVREVLGERTIFAGFYSYGEISPFTPNAKCELHNQTMTITTLSEKTE